MAKRTTYSPSQHKIKALVFWDSGTWKTTFGGTAKDAVFLSAEWGLLSLWRDVATYDIKSLSDLKNALVDLREELEAWTCPFKTVVIDSITEINDIVRTSIEKELGDKGMTFKERGELSKIMQWILRGFRDLDMHVLFIAHEKSEKDEDRLLKYKPSLNGKAADSICYYMDIVWYTEILKSEDGVNYSLVVEPKPYAPTKCRGGYIVDKTPANFEKWIEVISGDQKSVPVSKVEKKGTPYSDMLKASWLDGSHKAGLKAIKTIEAMDKDQVQEWVEILKSQIDKSTKLDADEKKSMNKLADFLLSYF